MILAMLGDSMTDMDVSHYAPFDPSTQAADAIVAPAGPEVGREFRTLFETHYDFVARSLRRLGVSELQLEDACQEVFIRVHRKLPEFRGDSSLRSWMFGFVRRIASLYRRTEQRRQRRHDDLHLRLHTTGADCDRGKAAELDASLLLDSVLDQLGPREREVFALVELEGFTGRELAEYQKIGLPAAHSRIRMTRQRVKQILNRGQRRERSLAALHPGLLAALAIDAPLASQLPILSTCHAPVASSTHSVWAGLAREIGSVGLKSALVPQVVSPCRVSSGAGRRDRGDEAKLCRAHYELRRQRARRPVPLETRIGLATCGTRWGQRGRLGGLRGR